VTDLDRIHQNDLVCNTEGHGLVRLGTILPFTETVITLLTLL